MKVSHADHDLFKAIERSFREIFKRFLVQIVHLMLLF